MSDEIEHTARHLRAQREKIDPLSRARQEEVPRPECVLEALERLRDIVLDRTPDEQLVSDLQVASGLLAGLVGAEKAGRLVAQLPDVRHCIAMDVEAAYDGDPAASSFGEILVAYPSTIAVSAYRIAHAFYQLGEPVVARIMAEDAHGRTGIDIHPGARIGCHFFVDHGTGVVVGETTVIGNRVKIYHGVTLGAFSNRNGRLDQGRKRHPTIEDDVTIYPNATILGGDTVVGKGSVIGGNAWVTDSIPPGTRVAIEPCTQVRSKGPESEIAPDREL